VDVAKLLLKILGGISFAIGGIWLFYLIGIKTALAIMLVLLGLALQYMAREIKNH
jgi:membrane protein implicated in regulation of membrane protease activity